MHSRALFRSLWFLSILVILSMACGLVSQAGELKSTAETMATQVESGKQVLGTGQALATEFGESTYDNALPFTRIEAARYSHLGNFKPIVGKLMAQHKARVVNDREFMWWSEDVAEFRAEREKKTLSLNEGVRSAERDRMEAKRKARDAERKALGLADAGPQNNDDGLQANERDVRVQVAEEEAAKNRPDPLMRESAAILADAISLLKGNQVLTTQVLVTKNDKVWAN